MINLDNFILIIYLLPIFILLIVPIITIIIDKKTEKIVKKENLNIIDFKNNKEYYREILKKYSPFEISYIDEFEIDYIKDIVSTLLNLQLKNKISIEGNYITTLDEKENIDGLYKSEIYVLNKIKNGKVIINDYREILEIAKEEALLDGLIVRNKINIKEKITIKRTIITIILIILTIGFAIVYNSKFLIIYYFLFYILVSFIEFCNSIKEESYIYHKKRTYKRTNKGEVLNKKIEGLRNYIKEFSLLNEKEQKEIFLWEDYLIYSTIFGINNKIIDKLSNSIKLNNKR